MYRVCVCGKTNRLSLLHCITKFDKNRCTFLLFLFFVDLSDCACEQAFFLAKRIRNQHIVCFEQGQCGQIPSAGYSAAGAVGSSQVEVRVMPFTILIVRHG